MIDVEITKDASAEFMVAHLEGMSEEGTDFIDGYMPGDAKMEVLDSGRIILSEADLPNFIERCTKQGLKIGEAGV